MTFATILTKWAWLSWNPIE